MIAAMAGTSIAVGPGLVAVLGALAVTAAAVVRRGGLGPGRPVLVAAVRAAVQLSAVSLVIAAVLRSGWLTAAFVAVMFTVASLTSAQRIATRRRARWA